MKKTKQTKSLQNGKAGKKPAQPDAQIDDLRRVVINHTQRFTQLEDDFDRDHDDLHRTITNHEQRLDAQINFNNRVSEVLAAFDRQLAFLQRGKTDKQGEPQLGEPGEQAPDPTPIPDYDTIHGDRPENLDASGDTTLYETPANPLIAEQKRLINTLHDENNRLKRENKDLTDAVEVAVRRLLQAQGKLRGEG